MLPLQLVPSAHEPQSPMYAESHVPGAVALCCAPWRLDGECCAPLQGGVWRLIPAGFSVGRRHKSILIAAKVAAEIGLGQVRQAQGGASRGRAGLGDITPFAAQHPRSKQLAQSVQ